ncbi:MAG: SDR family oxidoreductase [Thiolinea sp.]
MLDGGEPNRIDRIRPSIPLKRGGTPAEVAAAIAWLLSDEASYVTGSLYRGGGWTLKTCPLSFALFIQLLTLLATVTLAISGGCKLRARDGRWGLDAGLRLRPKCSLRDALIGLPRYSDHGSELSGYYPARKNRTGYIISVRYIPTGRGIRLRLLDVADAIGLALFAVLGARENLAAGFV